MQETHPDGSIEAEELNDLDDPKLKEGIRRLDLRRTSGLAVGEVPAVGEVYTLNGLQFRVTKRLKGGRIMLKLVGTRGTP